MMAISVRFHCYVYMSMKDCLPLLLYASFFFFFFSSINKTISVQQTVYSEINPTLPSYLAFLAYFLENNHSNDLAKVATEKNRVNFFIILPSRGILLVCHLQRWVFNVQSFVQISNEIIFFFFLLFKIHK